MLLQRTAVLVELKLFGAAAAGHGFGSAVRLNVQRSRERHVIWPPRGGSQLWEGPRGWLVFGDPRLNRPTGPRAIYTRPTPPQAGTTKETANREGPDGTERKKRGERSYCLTTKPANRKKQRAKETKRRRKSASSRHGAAALAAASSTARRRRRQRRLAASGDAARRKSGSRQRASVE